MLVGIVGESGNFVVEYCCNNGNIGWDESEEFEFVSEVGGLVGNLSNGTVRFSINLGSIIDNMKQDAGGIAGLCMSSTITECVMDSAVQGLNCGAIYGKSNDSLSNISDNFSINNATVNGVAVVSGEGYEVVDSNNAKLSKYGDLFEVFDSKKVRLKTGN